MAVEGRRFDPEKSPGDWLLYVHTTDYPMHRWPPEAKESKRHLALLDAGFGEIAAAAPDAGILLTADHGMNHKSRCRIWKRPVPPEA